MADKSNYLESELINHIFRSGSFAKPAALYVALFTAAPDPETGAGGTEVSGGGYARVQVGPSDSAWDAPASGGDTANSAEVIFPTPSADLGLATHSAIFDAPTGGNMIYSRALVEPRSLSTGTAVRFPAGTITISEG